MPYSHIKLLWCTTTLHHLLSNLRIDAATISVTPYVCLECTGKNFPSAFTYTCTFYQAVSIRLLISEKAPRLLVLISSLPADVQYSDTYNKAATAEALSAYCTSISGFPFVLCHFFHYYQVICISFRIKTFQVRFLLLLNHLCNVFFHNIQTCRPTFQSLRTFSLYLLPLFV